MESASDKILIEGNKAAALGVLFGGTSVPTWCTRSRRPAVSPNTPKSSSRSTESRRTASGRLLSSRPKTKLAAVGMAIGAEGWAGAAAARGDSSGPGISAHVRVRRRHGPLRRGPGRDHRRPAAWGPAPALPTRTSQGDILKLHVLGHGDSRHIVLIPRHRRGMLLAGRSRHSTWQHKRNSRRPSSLATDLDHGDEPVAHRAISIS